MEGANLENEIDNSEKILQNAYFTSEFSYFCQNTPKSCLYQESIKKMVYCSVDQILLVLYNTSSFIRVMNTNFETIIDYHINIKGKRSSKSLVDFDYDSSTKTLGMINENKVIKFCAIDFIHLNVDSTLKITQLDELQTRLWFLKDISFWVTAGSELVLRVWKLCPETDSLQELYTIQAHNDIVTDLKYISKIESIISCSMDGTLKMWSQNFRLKHSDIVKKAPGFGSEKEQKKKDTRKETKASHILKEGGSDGVRGFVISNTSDNLLLCWGFSNDIRVYEASALIGFERIGKLEGHLGVSRVLKYIDCQQLCSIKLVNLCNFDRR